MSEFNAIMDSARLSDDSTLFTVPSSWTQGRALYGGLQGALVVKAMRSKVADLPLRSVQITFIGPVEDGEVRVRARLLRRGKNVAHVQAEICDGDSVRLIAVGIFAAERPSEARLDPPMPPAARSLAESIAVPADQTMRPPFFHHFECRAAEGSPLYSSSKTTLNKFYARLRSGAVCSDEFLACMSDLAPPVAAVQLSKPAPGSSMNWHLDFVRRPAEIVGNEWFRVDAEVLAADHGYSYQNCSIWTEAGELVLLSRQCMALYG